jgi:peroxiredoxin
MLADTQGELARELGLVLDAEKVLGNKRCKRFSVYVVDGVVKVLNLEP